MLLIFLRAENIATLSDGMLHGGGSDLMLVRILCTYSHTYTWEAKEDGGAELVYTTQRGKSLLWVQFVATLPIQSESLLCLQSLFTADGDNKLNFLTLCSGS